MFPLIEDLSIRLSLESTLVEQITSIATRALCVAESLSSTIKQNMREKEIAFDLEIKAKLSLSETAVKVGSRATFPNQAANV